MNVGCSVLVAVLASSAPAGDTRTQPSLVGADVRSSDPADERLASQLTHFKLVPEGGWPRLRAGDPRWTEAVDAVLAETRKVAVEGSIDGASGGTLLQLPTSAIREPDGQRRTPRDEATARLGDMAECYRQALGRRAAPRTGVDLRMKVGTDGVVREAHLLRFEPSLSQVEDCIVQAARVWQFPKSFRQQAVRVRFAFPMAFNR